MSKYYFTEEGFRKLKREIDDLERFIKVDCARDLATAAAHGDLRENAEYAAAKEKQALSMAKLRQLRERMTNAEVVRKADLPLDTVTLGKRVKFKQLDTEEVETYTILGEGESDIENGIISYQTPLARCLIGKKVGEVAELRMETAVTEFEILEINFFDE